MRGFESHSCNQFMLAERITALETPLNTRLLAGFVLLYGVDMDKVEAKRNLKRYEAEINKYQSLSRGLMSRDEMLMVDKKITQFKEWSKNIRRQLNA